MNQKQSQNSILFNSRSSMSQSNTESKKKYAFFSHKECEYFPCHKITDPSTFNCLFCYCPLYTLGSDCGGAFTYTEKGIKDCKNCILPHQPDSLERIQSKFPGLARLAGKNKI